MPRQYFFWKYFNTIIVLYCIIVQKSPIFVQLSPIQCTYSNIFIRFFKFFPANTNIYQNSYRVIGALCGLRQGVLSSQCGYLISFGTKYLMSLQCGVPSGRLPRYARNDIKCVARDNVKKVCRLCYYFSANKRLLCSVRSTLSFWGAKRRENLPEG